MILKTHLMITPWDKLVQAYEGDETVNMFDFTVPWQNIPKDYHVYEKVK
jgi:hypothetical protein